MEDALQSQIVELNRSRADYNDLFDKFKLSNRLFEEREQLLKKQLSATQDEVDKLKRKNTNLNSLLYSQNEAKQLFEQDALQITEAAKLLEIREREIIQKFQGIKQVNKALTESIKEEKGKYEILQSEYTALRFKIESDYVSFDKYQICLETNVALQHKVDHEMVSLSSYQALETQLRDDFTSNHEFNRVSSDLAETLEDKRILEEALQAAQVARNNAVTMSSEAEARVISLKGRVEQTERELYDLRSILEQRAKELFTVRAELAAAEEQRTSAMQENMALETHKSLILTQIGNARMALRKETDLREAAVAALHRLQGDEDAVNRRHLAELQQTRLEAAGVASAHKMEVDRLIAKYQHEISELNSAHQLQTERIKAQWNNEVESLTARHTAEIAKLSSHYQGEVDQANRETEWRVAEVKETAAVALNRHQSDSQLLRETHQADIQQLQNKHKVEVEHLRLELTSKMTSGSQHMRSVFDAAQHELESSLEMSSLANSDLQAQLKESQREVEALAASCSSYQKTILDLRTQGSSVGRQCDVLEAEVTALREDKEAYQGSISTYQRVVSELRSQTVPFEEHVAVNRSLQEDKTLLIGHIHALQSQIDEFKRAVLEGAVSVDGDASPHPLGGGGDMRSFSTSQVERIIHSHNLQQQQQQQQQHSRSLSPSALSRFRRLQEEGAYRVGNMSAVSTPASAAGRAFFDRSPPPSIHGSNAGGSSSRPTSPRANNGFSRSQPLPASSSPHKHGNSSLSLHHTMHTVHPRSRSPSPRRNAVTSLASSPAAPLFSPGLVEYPSPIFSPSPAPPSRLHTRQQPPSPQTIRGLATSLSVDHLSYRSPYSSPSKASRGESQSLSGEGYFEEEGRGGLGMSSPSHLLKELVSAPGDKNTWNKSNTHTKLTLDTGSGLTSTKLPRTNTTPQKQRK